ncbi:MAG: hypothetical protein AABY22_14640 [Nanoarchaeota archaeon]
MKTKIPQICKVCGKKNLWYDKDNRNYTYWKGHYYHTKCFN